MNKKNLDCDDTNVNVYPGRNENSHSSDVDHNCNGIFGTDANGGDYEELLCSNSSQRGVIVLGDSIRFNTILLYFTLFILFYFFSFFLFLSLL